MIIVTVIFDRKNNIKKQAVICIRDQVPSIRST